MVSVSSYQSIFLCKIHTISTKNPYCTLFYCTFPSTFHAYFDNMTHCGTYRVYHFINGLLVAKISTFRRKWTEAYWSITILVHSLVHCHFIITYMKQQNKQKHNKQKRPKRIGTKPLYAISLSCCSTCCCRHGMLLVL